MTEKRTSGNEHWTSDFSAVIASEREWIEQRRKAVDCQQDAPIIGLSLSGGGIRSATFNLGILECLSRHNLLNQVDYLSTVSGGGYIGSCYSWVRSQQKAEPNQAFSETEVKGSSDRNETCDEKESLLDWLRAHGDYLIAGKGFSFWQLMASILAGTLLNLTVMLPVFIWLFFVASMNLGQMEWPVWLHFSGAPQVHEHDGFLLLLVAGVLSTGLYLVSIVLFALSTAFSVFAPLSKHYYIRKLMGRLLAFGMIGIAVGLLPVVAGFEHWFAKILDDESVKGLGRDLSWLVPLISGIGAMWRSAKNKKSVAGGGLLAKLGIALLAYSFFVLIYHLVNHTGLMDSPIIYWWSGLSVLLALTVNVNAISMHSYYRGRLALAYLPKLKHSANKKTHPMDFELAKLSEQFGAPLQIVNTTMNTSSSALQKLRSRKGENFFLTSLYSGSTHTGFITTKDYANKKMALSTAFSVSGAAVDPNTYATDSRPVAFLMALLNFRLGYWTDNPRFQQNGGQRASWYRLMLREMLGIKLDEKQQQIHLSDGGHFENLALYELFRRRVPYIIVGDAGADPEGTFADLGKAIQRARADFGVEVDIDLKAVPKPTELSDGCRCLRGKIIYPKAEGQDELFGHILYIKSALRSPLSADIYSYWRQKPQFPDQSTADQFFDELQFDAYRELGNQLVQGLLKGKQHLTDIIESE